MSSPIIDYTENISDDFLGNIIIEPTSPTSPFTKMSKPSYKTPPKKSKTFPYFLGSGSYGEVSMIDSTTVKKKMPIFEGSNINTRNLREVILLSSYRAPFIPEVKRVEYSFNFIYLYESYQGKTLKDLAEELTYEERIILVPSLLIQFARILTWLKIHNIAHMDIKPANVTFSDDGILSLIDFGLASPVCVNTNGYCGTHVYGDPFTVKFPKVSYKYDMFGVAMTIFAFLNKGHIEEDEHKKIIGTDCNEKLYEHLNFKYHEDAFNSVLGNKNMSNLLGEMLWFGDEECFRIKPHTLYNHPSLSHLRRHFPLDKEITNINNHISDKVEFVNDKCESRFIESCIKYILEESNALFLFSYSYKLFCILQHSMVIDSPVKTAMTCVHIAGAIFDIDMPYKGFGYWEIHAEIIRCLKSLGYNIFPKSNFADWELIRTKYTMITEWFSQSTDTFLMEESKKRVIIRKINKF
jgi:serine/threonine protein kinase